MRALLPFLRLWGSRVLWLLVAGAITVMIALLPEGLVYTEDRMRVLPGEARHHTPGEPFLIQPWEQQSRQERHWHWSPSTYAASVTAFGKDLISGELHYTVPAWNPAFNRSYPILPRVKEAWYRSAAIFGVALVGGVLVGLLIGSLAVGRRLARNLSLGISVGFMGIPEFIIVLLGQVATVWTYHHWGFRLWTVGVPGGERHWVLPVVALSILPIGYTARLMAGALDEIMREDYIRTARSKGVHEWRIVLGHAFKNALPRVLNGLPAIINGTLSSLVIVELLTSWPGIGRLLQPPPEDAVLWSLRLFGQPLTYGQPVLLASGGLLFCAWFILLNGFAHTIRLLASPLLREGES